jgi:hypothetical protein
VRFFIGKRHEAAARDKRLANFQRVLAAALETEYYRPVLKAARLDTLDSIFSLRTVNDGLIRLPAVPYSVFAGNREVFRNPLAPAPARGNDEAVLPDPWRRKPGDDAVAGSLEALRRLAAEVRAGRTSIPGSAARIIVQSRVDGGMLTEADRDFLWDVFELPVFEELRGFDGEVLAAECEGHEALHIHDEIAVCEWLNGGRDFIVTSLGGIRYPLLRLRTNLTASFRAGVCACGQRASRLACEMPWRIGVKRETEPHLRMAVATAAATA